MKRILILFLVVFIICSLSVPAFASEGEPAGQGESSSGAATVLVPDVNVINEINVPDDDPGVYLGSSVSTYAAYASGSSDLKSVLQQFVGEWDTIVVSHTYQASDGSTYTVNETVPDYPWLCSAALLCLMIFCLFRLGGSILCKT